MHFRFTCAFINNILSLGGNILVSHQYKFIYLKSAKTASTSTFVFFTPYCLSEEKLKDFDYSLRVKDVGNYGEKGIVGFKKARKSLGQHHRHVKAIQVKKILDKKDPNIWKNYFKFSIVRNPWDIVVSMYYFRKQMKNITFSFEEFIQKLKKETIFNDLILKIKNKFVCDYHIRFENLKEGIKNVCDICEIKNYDLNNLPKFHSDSRPKNLNYRDVHNKKTKNIIAKLYKSYIKEFNYEY